MIDSLLRLQERKYVDSGSSSGPTNGGPQLAGVVTAAGRLHFDHSGAEVAEHHRGVRTGEGAGKVDDGDAIQRAGHGNPSDRRTGRWRGTSSDQRKAAYTFSDDVAPVAASSHAAAVSGSAAISAAMTAGSMRRTA